jgi:hypothetical protein
MSAAGPCGSSRTLLSGPDEVMESIDMAANVIAAGALRTGRPVCNSASVQ